MKIIVDQDQVLACWVERIIEYWNQDKQTNIKLEDISSWNMTDTLGPGSEDFMRSCMRYPDFYRDLDPIPGAVEGMKELIDRGHDVYIATAVPKCAGIAYHGKMAWLRDHMPFFNLNNFIAIQKKYLLQGDVLLDDGEHNVIPWRESGRLAVVYDQPWNQNLTGERVKSWKEFVQFIEDRRLPF